VLKPVQCCATARALKLNPDQLRRLEQIEKNFRQAMADAGEADAPHRTAMVEKLVGEIAAMLDAPQRPNSKGNRTLPPPAAVEPEQRADVRAGWHPTRTAAVAHDRTQRREVAKVLRYSATSCGGGRHGRCPACTRIYP